ncbi:MAG: hypothetical protein R3B40_31370 [Polyangiales bacterium]|nr:hypothetical protein [Myxococcales bacterium]MCB9658681.1 hypothetical protein [Sandaracinaceae bacterium]
MWTAVPAAAQSDGSSSEQAPAAWDPPQTVETSPTFAAPAAADYGPRFRFGVSGGGGAEFVDGLSAWMVGVDFRIGLQINEMIAIYAQPHLSFGKFGGTGSGLAGTTGTFAVAAMVDLTFSDMFAVAGGFGYGVFNNPSGPMLALRGAFYPLSNRDEVSGRRRALSVGVDLRTVFLGSPYGTGVHLLATVGYEAF